MIITKKEEIEGLAFIKLALAKKTDLREVFRYIFVTEQEIVATNGQILHIIPNTFKLKTGLYLMNRINKNKAEIIELNTDQKYPDYNSAINPAENYPDFLEFKTAKLDLNFLYAMIIKANTNENIIYSVDYVSNILDMQGEVIKVYINYGTQILAVSDKGYKAIIMGIQITNPLTKQQNKQV